MTFSQSAQTAAPDPTALERRQPIDWEYLHQLCDDTPEFAWELLGVFTADSQINLKTLKQAIVDRDYWQTEQAAHRIKGASASIGATVVSAAAAQIEQQSLSQHFEAIDRLLQNLEAALYQIQSLIETSG